MSREVLRQRVASVYQAYAPEKLANLDAVIDRHADQPDALMEALVDKYGPEPVIQPPPQPRRARSQSQVASSEDEAMKKLKELAMDDGFLSQEHAVRWEEVWYGKIPLSTICKNIDDVLKEDWGYKHSSMNKTFVPKWQRRYFAIIPPFVYYFEKDDIQAPCRGCIYLPRSTVTEIEADGKIAIEIQTQVQRKPTQSGGTQDYNAFIIYFDAEKQQKTWLEILRRLSQMTGKKTRSSRDQQASPARRDTVAPQYMTLPPPPAQVIVQRELPISRDELNNRIRRVASERDPSSVVDAVLNFIETDVTDTVALWRLMEAVEATRRLAPEHQPFMTHPQHASLYGSLYSSGLASPPSQRAMAPQPSFVKETPPQAPKTPAQILSEAAAFTPLPPRPADAPLDDASHAGDGGDEGSSSAPRRTAEDGASDMSPAQLNQLHRTQADMQSKFEGMLELMRQQSEANLVLQRQLAQAQAQAGLQQPQPHLGSMSAGSLHPMVIPAYSIPRSDTFASLRQNSLDLSPGGSTLYHGAPPPADSSLHQASASAYGPLAAQYQSPPGAAPSNLYDSPLGASSRSMHSDAASPAGTHLSQRLDRMRSRKKILDDMMRDLPS